METNDWWNDPTKRDQTLKVNTEFIPPPPPPVKRSSSFVLVVCVLCLVIIAGGSVIFSALYSSYSHAIPTPVVQKPTATLAPTATPTLTPSPTPVTVQTVLTAIEKVPNNDVYGNGVSYGSSVSNWLGSNVYTDSAISSSSATWNYRTPAGGPCCLSGIWVYTSLADAHQEYMTLQQEDSIYYSDLQQGIGVPQFPYVLTDVGIVVWTQSGHCVAGNLSGVDSLALPNSCA